MKLRIKKFFDKNSSINRRDFFVRIFILYIGTRYLIKITEYQSNIFDWLFSTGLPIRIVGFIQLLYGLLFMALGIIIPIIVYFTYLQRCNNIGISRYWTIPKAIQLLILQLMVNLAYFGYFTELLQYLPYMIFIQVILFLIFLALPEKRENDTKKSNEDKKVNL